MTPPVPAGRYPVSIKGVLAFGGQVVLLKNERAEWELPGGRLEPGESPETALLREIREELSIDAHEPRIVDSWLYRIDTAPGAPEVFVVTYALHSNAAAADCRLSGEHREIGLFRPAALAHLRLPQGYRDSIARARSLGLVQL